MFVRSAFFGVVLLALLAYGFLNGLSLAQLINIQSMAIVLGGIIMVIWIAFPAERIRATCRALLHGVRRNRSMEADTRELLPEVLELARIYRLKGPLALERAVDRVKNPYLRFGASLIAEGYDRWALVSALEREMVIASGERRAQIQMLNTLTRLAPALGMAGTVVSLMHVMQDLGTARQLGPSMGLALSSTLYGIMLANLCFLPLASKLEEIARREVCERSLITEALLGLQQAMHPLRIAEKLNAYDIYRELRRQETEDTDASKAAGSETTGVMEQAMARQALNG